MRFTWTGLILAPLLVPVLFSVAFVSFSQGARPEFGVPDTAGPGLHRVLRRATIFLFLPCPFLLSLWRPITGFKVCLLGGTGSGRDGVRTGDVDGVEK
jgi:hypothetical protein